MKTMWPVRLTRVKKWGFSRRLVMMGVGAVITWWKMGEERRALEVTTRMFEKQGSMVPGV